jgi:UDP-N-acetylmuramyl pentapeptide phosphotransferase/UDP-N-acetylglucosamine-1-phosphate transferase
MSATAVTDRRSLTLPKVGDLVRRKVKKPRKPTILEIACLVQSLVDIYFASAYLEKHYIMQFSIAALLAVFWYKEYRRLRRGARAVSQRMSFIQFAFVFAIYLVVATAVGHH